MQKYSAIRILKALVRKGIFFAQRARDYVYYRYLTKWAERFYDNYETTISIMIARNLAFLYMPQVYFLKLAKIRLLANVGEAAGHIITDIDHYLQMKHAGKLDRKCKFWWIQKPRDDSNAIKSLYADKFDYCGVSHILYVLFLPVILSRRDLTVDVGLSRLKHHLAETYNDKAIEFTHPPFHSQVSKADGYRQWVSYYRLRGENMPLRPLHHTAPFPLPKQLAERLGDASKPLALVHLRYRSGINATAAGTDPKTYVPAISYLFEQGYRVVLVGREDLPPEFEGLPIINYSRSGMTSYENDLRLFSNADFVLTAGSGISMLADVLHIPAVYANYWHLNMCMFSPNCILLPTIVDRLDGSPLSFVEQINLYMGLPDSGSEVFPEEEYRARNCTGEELLAAVKESLRVSIDKPQRTENQERFSNLDPQGMMGASHARVGQMFIENHKDRL